MALATCLTTALGATQVRAETPNVVVSIKPLHSLIANVMAGAGEPGLLLEGAASPHDASLKPSQARAIQDADMIIWMGELLETFLVKSVEASDNAKTSLPTDGKCDAGAAAVPRCSRTRRGIWT